MPARLQFTIDEAGELVVDVVEDVEDVEEGVEEAAKERIEEATEEETEEELGKTNDATDGIEDNWLIAAAVGALGLGGAYRLLAHRSDTEDDT